MNGREDKKANDLFFTCSLIEYIARKTKNKSSVVIEALGKDNLDKIYDLADIYHSDNIERVAGDFIEESGLTTGSYDSVGLARYSIPSHCQRGMKTMSKNRL